VKGFGKFGGGRLVEEVLNRRQRRKQRGLEEGAER
jgi:hypothetical protein